VVYETLTGHPPFRRDDDMALLWAHQYVAPPALSESRPGLPASLDAVFAKALAKTPDGRHDSCLAFVAALRSAATGGHPPTEVAPRTAEPPETRPKPPPRWAEPVIRGR
jgi:serine/threonine-protein kinase